MGTVVYHFKDKANAKGFAKNKKDMGDKASPIRKIKDGYSVTIKRYG
jgi:hypothetical protein